MKKVHKSVTADRLMALIDDAMRTLDNPGVCLACGEDADHCEPDARQYTCECCGKPEVYGAEELLLNGYYHGQGRKI